MAGERPKLTVRRGAISVSAWENEHEGRKYYSAKLIKRYKDKKTGKWEDTHYLSGEDMLVAAELLREAYSFAYIDDDASGFVRGSSKAAGGGEPDSF